MGKRVRWILFGVVLIGVIVAGLVRQTRSVGPAARFTMADGAELRLEYVTYGTHHVVPGAGKFAAWLSVKAQMLPHWRARSYDSEYSRDTDAPCPILWFTRRDPRTRVFLSFSGTSYISMAAPYADQTVSAGGAPPMPSASCEVPCYDRRKPTFRVRLHNSGQAFDFDVKSPVAGATFPEWKPEPLPQTRYMGKYEVVLRSLELTRWGDGVLRAVPHVEVFEAGEVLTHWEPTYNLSDATGNETRAWIGTDILPLTESAWKVKWKLSRVHGSDVQSETVEFIVAPPALPPPP